MKRLLIITQTVDQSDPVLGFFHRWIIEFAKHVDTIIVICLRQGSSNLPPNVKVFSLGKEEGRSRLKYLYRFYLYIWKERFQYDAVFVHMNPIYTILGWPLWKFWGKKVSLWYLHKHVDAKLRLAVLSVDRVFTASRQSFRLATPKLLVIGHGIDMDVFRPLTKVEHKQVVISIVGRISDTKRVKEAVRMLVELPANTVLSIVGSPMTLEERVYAEEVRKEISALDLFERVRFEGTVLNHQIPEYLAGVDIALNLSKTGSLDKVVLEAIACGIPVISSNEAFEDLLTPHGLYLHSLNGESVRSAFNAALKQGVAEDLRREVVSRHSLGRLIPAIISDINNETGK